MKKKNVRQGFLPYLFLIIFMVVVYIIFSSMNKKINKLTYKSIYVTITNCFVGFI